MRVLTFMRSLIVLDRAFRPRPLRVRLHVWIRYLTCPFARVLEHVPDGATLLDVGAGHGLFAVLAKGGRRVVAVEPDVRKVRPVDGVDFVLGYDDCIRGTFDVVSVIDVLYKIPIAEWDAVLARLAARTGSLLLIKEHDPTARVKHGWNRLQEWLVSKVGLTLGQSFSYEPPEMFVARLKRHGFARVEARRIGRGYPHPHILYAALR
jgi:hypothetical protein